MEIASSNGALMRRIVQLEKERDELQKDVESICLQQAGVAGSIDVNTRMQARRAASLEQELDLCKEKMMLLSRENDNLQEELSEAYRVKTQLTEAFKRAVEKNNQVEKEVKFYQSKVAAGFAERDKAIVEVERVHETEKAMSDKVQQLYNRVEEAEKRCKEQETQKVELQHDFDTSMERLDILCKVVDKFWGLRGNLLTTSGDDQYQLLQSLERATTLVSESDDQWAYGGSNQKAEEALQQELKDAQNLAEQNSLLHVEQQLRATELDAQLANLKEDVKATTQSLQTQIVEKQNAQQQAVEKAYALEIQLAKLQKYSISKLLELQNDHEVVRASLNNLLEDEKQWVESMVVKFEALLSQLKASEIQPEIVDKYEEERDSPQEEIPSPSGEPSGSVELEETHTSEDIIELEVPVSNLQDQNAPESVDSESSHTPDIPVTVSTSSPVEPEITVGAHPVAETNDIIISEVDPCPVVVTLSRSAPDVNEEGRKALAQALHEKVEALLLLSQQEERYYLESKTIQGLEFQIKDLNEKISQVTREKVSALMEVAQVRQDCHRLEERERELIRRLQLHRSTNAGGRLLPANWSEPNASPSRQEKSYAVAEKQLIVPKPSLMTTSGYLKSWFGGHDVIGPGGLKATSEPTKLSLGTNTCKSLGTEEPVDFAKLRVENAALQERVAGVQRLTESAHRLRMTLVKVSTDSEMQQSVKSLHSALQIVNGVNREASHLRIALGCSLPLSVTPESPSSQFEGGDLSSMSNSSDGEVHTAVDVAQAAGIEMVELLLAACELQKAGLQRQIDILTLQWKATDDE